MANSLQNNSSRSQVFSQFSVLRTKLCIFPLFSSFRANWTNSEIKILALTLRDGVLLCNLIHFLDPAMESIDFNRRPRDAQVCELLLHFIISVEISMRRRNFHKTYGINRNKDFPSLPEFRPSNRRLQPVAKQFSSLSISSIVTVSLLTKHQNFSGLLPSALPNQGS